MEKIKVDTKELYDGRFIEKFEGTGGLSVDEFNDVMKLMKKWIKQNNVKTKNLNYIKIEIYDNDYENTFSFGFRPDDLASKKLEVKGTNKINLEEFIESNDDTL